MGVDMKTPLILAAGLMLLAGPLLALGYTSAYVETNKAYDRMLEEEGETYYKSEDGYSGGGYEPAPTAYPPYNTYQSAQNLQLAVPSLDPLTDVTTRLIYSLADVILLRFKQQLFVSSVSQWRDELLGSDFSCLYPNLSELLTSIDAGSFLSSFDLWKSAIDKDLQEAPLGVTSYRLAVREADPTLSPEERSLLTELKSLLGDIYNYRDVDNLHQFIQVSTSSLNNDSGLFKLIGLVAKNMIDENGEFVLDQLKEHLDYPGWSDLYIENVNDDIADLRINNDSFTVTLEKLPFYLDSCETVKSFFDVLNQEARNDEDSRMDSAAFLGLYFNTCDKLLVQWSNLSASAATMDWDKYYQLYTAHRFEAESLARLVDKREYKALLNAVITTSVSIAQERDAVPVNYSRFLNLISTIALTGKEDQVDYRYLINAVIEPVGSYAYKRQADLTVDLNAYPGLGGGMETLNADLHDTKGVGGLACPIGLEFNWGRSFGALRGVFISALDLGAVATYRFTKGEEDVSSSPQLGWKQLVSPGLYLLLQQQNNPVTLGLGAQLTPSLRKVTQAGTVTEKNAMRVGAFLSVDIPVFTFYVRHSWMRPEKRTSSDK